jgi:hypothetical protein
LVGVVVVILVLVLNLVPVLVLNLVPVPVLNLVLVLEEEVGHHRPPIRVSEAAPPAPEVRLPA